MVAVGADGTTGLQQDGLGASLGTGKDCDRAHHQMVTSEHKCRNGHASSEVTQLTLSARNTLRHALNSVAHMDGTTATNGWPQHTRCPSQGITKPTI